MPWSTKTDAELGPYWVCRSCSRVSLEADPAVRDDAHKCDAPPAFWPYVVTWGLLWFLVFTFFSGLVIGLYLTGHPNPPSLTPTIEDVKP